MARAVIILKTDPGGYRPMVALAYNGLSSLAMMDSQLSNRVSGSKEGLETMARTLPVEGSETITAPRYPSS